MSSCSCGGCNKGETLIFACSGASTVGQIANEAAKSLRAQGVGSMFCIASIGGHLESALERTSKAEKVVLLDGCPNGCGLATLKQAGFEPSIYLELSQVGLKKGEVKGEPKAEDIQKVCSVIVEKTA